jgi:hypothetical protein
MQDRFAAVALDLSDGVLLDTEYERHWDFAGGHQIVATFPIRNGVPQPHPIRVDVTSPHGLIRAITYLRHQGYMEKIPDSPDNLFLHVEGKMLWFTYIFLAHPIP